MLRGRSPLAADVGRWALDTALYTPRVGGMHWSPKQQVGGATVKRARKRLSVRQVADARVVLCACVCNQS